MQRRAAAPCLLCVVVTCAMCHRLRFRFVPLRSVTLHFTPLRQRHRRGVCCGLMLLRNAPFAPQAGRHYAAHVHFAPTPEEGIVYHGQLCQSFLCLGSAAPWGCSLAERHRLIGSVCHDFTSDNDSDTHHQYEIKKFFLMDTPIPDIQFCSR